MDLVTLLIQLASGIAGGVCARKLLGIAGLGVAGNAVAGLIGGMLGGQVLGDAFGTARLVAAVGISPGLVISEIAAAGIGGAVMTAFVSAIQRRLTR